MHPSDPETDESGNEYLGESKPSVNDVSYWKMLHKNRNQTASVTGGLILLFVSGLHIGWGLWRVTFNEPWMSSQPRSLFIFTKMSWYVTAIIGGFTGSLLVTVLRKTVIYYICATMLVISSLIYIIWYDEFIAITVGRCLAGMGHGIVYLTVVIHASENAAKEVRGTVLAMINVMIFVAVTISSTVITKLTYDHGDMNSDRVIGIFGLIFSLLSIPCTIFLAKESVAYLLYRNKNDEALDCLKELRDEANETRRLTIEIEELKSMVHEDRNNDRNIFTDGNAKPLAMLIILFTLGVLTNNYLVNIILFNFLGLAIEWPHFMLAPVVLASVRGGVAIFSVFLADIIGRKLHILITGITLTMAIIISIIIVVTSPHVWLAGSFAIAFQIFVAIGIDPIQHILLSEAFASSKKTWSISFVTAIENLLQILFIGMYFMTAISIRATYILVACCLGVIVILVVILLLGLPETKGMSLKEARDEFRNDEYRKRLYSGYNCMNCRR